MVVEQFGKLPCTVSKWGSNSVQPDLNIIDRIAPLLNVDRRDLLVPSKKEE